MSDVEFIEKYLMFNCDICPSKNKKCKDNSYTRFCYDQHEVLKRAITALSFKEYFDSLYGQGLEIANYHLNGDLEPFDNFYDSAIEKLKE